MFIFKNWTSQANPCLTFEIELNVHGSFSTCFVNDTKRPERTRYKRRKDAAQEADQQAAAERQASAPAAPVFEKHALQLPQEVPSMLLLRDGIHV